MRSASEAIRPLWSLLTVFVVLTVWVHKSDNLIEYDPRMLFLLIGTVFSNVAVSINYPLLSLQCLEANVVSSDRVIVQIWQFDEENCSNKIFGVKNLWQYTMSIKLHYGIRTIYSLEPFVNNSDPLINQLQNMRMFTIRLYGFCEPI